MGAASRCLRVTGGRDGSAQISRYTRREFHRNITAVTGVVGVVLSVVVDVVRDFFCAFAVACDGPKL